MSRLVVGDPASSSLSSCLCAFPGGFSLLTERGLLRPYLVSDAAAGTTRGSAASTAAEEEVVVVAAAPVRLSEQSGAFPAGKDVPVDHAWSHDGALVVVLRRFGYTAYWRDPKAAVSSRAPLLSPRRPDKLVGDSSSKHAAENCTPRPPSSGVPPSLGLAEVHTGSNGAEGKAVACCSLLDSHPAGASTAAAAANNSSSSSSSSRRGTYLIAVGVSFGIECRALDITSQPEEEEVGTEEGKHGLGEGHEADASAEKLSATCRPLTTIFQGYLVVALAFSPDSSLVAAAAMTGHVKVWDVAALVASPTPPPPPPQRSNVPTKKEPAAARRGRGKGRGFDEALFAMRPSPGQEGHSNLAALWGVALPMARVTSLSFSPNDSATFALVCWDGNMALFLPAAPAQAAVLPPNASLCKASINTATAGAPTSTVTAVGGGGGGGGDNDTGEGVGSKRAWKQVWREAAAPGKVGGGKARENLEDQDGTFLCWCKASDASTTDVAVSTYCTTTGDYSKRPCGVPDEDERGGETTLPTPRNAAREFPLPEPPREAYPPAMGPGIEVLAEGGLGGRIGGAVSASRRDGVTREPTAARYLIHGLAAGPGFVALYDSDLCLHVISIAAMLSDACVLPPPTPTIETEALSGHPDKASPGAAADAEASTPPRPTRNVTLVDNDHGLIAACVRRHSGPDKADAAAPPEGGLDLAITWRDASSGVETPDDGECVGQRRGENDRRLSFLPGELAGDYGGGDDDEGGVFCADLRWQRFALFTRETVLVYTRPAREQAGRKGQGAPCGNALGAGGWRAYAEYPIAHGLLLGGASTATSLSKSLPKAPEDLTDIYLLVVLGANAQSSGDGPVLSIRSLRDRSVTCRCPLSSSSDDVGEAGAVARQPGTRVYASPGCGGGVFVVAAEGGSGECARMWRGSFDEGSCRLKIGSSRVITSYPWPEPETLRLQGVAGPNCELILFKEVEAGSSSENRSNDDTGRSVRWWMTWPEAEIWKWVDAPALLGEEDLGVSDFVKIFQVEIEDAIRVHAQGPEA